MHNGRLSDPLDDFSKALKKITGKRSKTEDDLEEMARLEFLGSLYLSGGEPCLPGFCLEAGLAEAAKKTRQRKAAQASIFVPEDAKIIYKGPKDPDKLWKDKDFRIRASARVMNSRIIRTRPIFKEWQVDVSVSFDEGTFNPEDIESLLKVLGESVGLLDWRPKFGRFTVKM